MYKMTGPAAWLPPILFALVLTAPVARAVPPDTEDLPTGRQSDMGMLSDLPCVEGMAGDFQCHGVDLQAFVPLLDMNCPGSGNDIWGWTDPVTGTEYALMGCSTGIAFVDLSEPTMPVHMGNLPTQTDSSTWRDSKVFDDHAFVVSEASGHGLQVFDLTELRAVDSPPVEFEATAHLDTFGSAHNIEINTETGFAYVVGSGHCQGGLYIIDINDPTAPEVAGCYDDEGYTHDTQCVVYHGPDKAYKGREICFNSNPSSPTAGGDAVTIVDVTDKDAPELVSSTGYADSGYAHQGWLTEDHKYFLFGDELDEQNFGHNTRTRIWDVRDLENPEIIGIHDSTENAIDHNMYIVGDFMFQSNYTAGLRVLSLEEVAEGALTETAFFNVVPHTHLDHDLRHGDGPNFSGTWSNYPFFDSDIVVASSMGVSGEPGGLFVVRPWLEDSKLEGSVTRSDTGEAIEGAVIEVVAGLPHEALTGPEGTYQVDILPGTYAVKVSKPGFFPAEQSGIQVTEDSSGIADLSLDPAPVAGMSPDALEFQVGQGGSSSETLVIANSGDGVLEWTITHDRTRHARSRDVHDPDLDEILDIDDFQLPGSGSHADSAQAGIETRGQVIGFGFEGTVSGISGTGTWASDMAMTLTSPEGQHFSVGGFSTSYPDWDFQGSGSSSDGTYSSIHIGPDIFGDDGTADQGTWALDFEHTWDDAMDWSDVTVTLHKTAPPICEDPATVDWLSTDPDAGTTGGGASSEVVVTVDTEELETGTHEAFVCVATNDPEAPLIPVPLELVVLDPPPGELVLDADLLDFGLQLIGTETHQLLTVSNAAIAGAEEIELTELTITEGDSAFSVTGGDCQIGTTLAGQQSCELEFGFVPNEAGQLDGSATIGADPSQVESVALAGEGREPGELVVAPENFDFEAVWIGYTQSTTITVSNAAEDGSGSLEISGVDLSPGEFSSGDETTCLAGSTLLEPGQQCTVEVVFAPESQGEVAGELVVEVDDDVDGQSGSSSLAGTGEEAPPVIHEDRFEVLD